MTFELEQDRRIECAAGCGFAAKARVDGVPLCLACSADWYESGSRKRVEDWARERRDERARQRGDAIDST